MSTSYGVERYGISLGRLWIRWPEFYWRDLWIGAYVKESYWEMGEQKVNVYVCPLPAIVFLFVWTLKRGRG